MPVHIEKIPKRWYTRPCRTNRVTRATRATRLTRVTRVTRVSKALTGWPSYHILIFGMSESSGFQKYSTCWLFQVFCLCLCLCRRLCHCLCLCICVRFWFLNSYCHALSEYVWSYRSVKTRSSVIDHYLKWWRTYIHTMYVIHTYTHTHIHTYTPTHKHRFHL